MRMFFFLNYSLASLFWYIIAHELFSKTVRKLSKHWYFQRSQERQGVSRIALQYNIQQQERYFNPPSCRLEISSFADV